MKTRILIFTSTFLLCIPAVMSQDVTNNFRIGISGSLEKNVSSEIIAFSEYTGFSANYNKPNYRFGLNLEYLLKGNLKLNGAVNYSNKDFTGTYFCAVCDFDFPPGAEEVDFSFIEVPISLRYYFIPRRIQFFGEIGLNNIFTLNNPAYEARVNSYVIGYKLGGGLEYNLSKKIALQLALDYNKSISKLFKDSYFEGDYFKLRSINFIITILKKMALV